MGLFQQATFYVCWLLNQAHSMRAISISISQIWDIVQPQDTCPMLDCLYTGLMPMRLLRPDIHVSLVTDYPEDNETVIEELLLL